MTWRPDSRPVFVFGAVVAVAVVLAAAKRPLGCRGIAPAVMAHGCAASLFALERERCCCGLVYITTPADRFFSPRQCRNCRFPKIVIYSVVQTEGVICCECEEVYIMRYSLRATRPFSVPTIHLNSCMPSTSRPIFRRGAHKSPPYLAALHEHCSPLLES